MRRVTTLLLIILFSLLPFGTAFAGKGALIKVINSRDEPLKYSFSQASKLAKDTKIRDPPSGTINKNSEKNLGYLEGKFGAKAKIQLRLSADNREVKFALKDAWGWTMTTQKGGLFRVQIRHHEDKQDRFIITVFGDDDNFALKSWLGDQAKARSEWLDRSLADFALLGTHDSATYHYDFDGPFVEKYVKTQDRSIYEQLRSGVRFLDFRLGWKNAQVEMYHGDYSLNLSFAQAIGQVNRFLKENPNEFVLLSMKVDSGDRKKIGN